MALQKVGPYEVDPKEPWKNDKLDRKRVADYLTPVIASVTQPFTISLHSPYGTGKTSFIQSWQADLRNQGYKTVYFNAWETDFSQDAFLAFMSAIRTQLSGQSSSPGKVKEAVSNVARKGIWTAIKRGAPKLVKGAVKKIAGEETIDGALEIVGLGAEEIASASEEWAAAALETQEAQENSRLEFRSELQRFIGAELASSQDAAHRKLIVFVDDLDRCRPSYAIQLLEAIKHLFSVDGLLFILAVDEPQLAQAVTSVYGTGIDANGYLARFIDWRYSLLRPKFGAICDSLASRYRLSELPWVDERNDFVSVQSFVNVICIFGEGYSVSARELEKIFTLVNLCLRAQGNPPKLLMPVLAGAAVLRHTVRDELMSALTDHDVKIKFLNDANERLCRVDPRNVRKDAHQLIHLLQCWLTSREQMHALDAEANELQRKLNGAGNHDALSKSGVNQDTVSRMFDIVKYRSFLWTRFHIEEEPIRAPLRALETAGQIIYE